MLNQLVSYFADMLNIQKQPTYGSELERYIVSKGPTNAAEIDYWTQQYDRDQSRQGWL